jgi:hypothetical protein
LKRVDVRIEQVEVEVHFIETQDPRGQALAVDDLTKEVVAQFRHKTQVYRPVLWFLRVFIDIKILDQLLDRALSRLYEVDDIRIAEPFPLVLQPVDMIEPCLVDVKCLATAAEDLHSGFIHYQNQIVTVEFGVLLGCPDHVVDYSTLGVVGDGHH